MELPARFIIRLPNEDIELSPEDIQNLYAAAAEDGVTPEEWLRSSLIAAEAIVKALRPIEAQAERKRAAGSYSSLDPRERKA